MNVGDHSYQPQHQPDHGQGFTLFELVIIVAVAAILAGVAIPSYLTLTKNYRMAAQVNDLVTDLHTARNEAIRRSTTVTLCPSSNDKTCDTGSSVDWASGWIMFVDVDASGARQTPASGYEALLRVHASLHKNTTLDGGNNFPNHISYTAIGFSNNNGKFVFCDDRGPPYATAIYISKTGRIRIAHTDSKDKALACS